MKLNEQSFIAFCDRQGEHKAITHSYDNEFERDFKAKSLAKKKGIAYIKKRDIKRCLCTEYWVTEHYGEKDKIGRVWINHKGL